MERWAILILLSAIARSVGSAIVGGGGGSGMGGGIKAACINGGDHVRTPTGLKRVDHLVVGDRVATGKATGENLAFEPILTFLHRDTSRVATGFRFVTSSGRNLTLSDQHLVFLAHIGRAVFAKRVRVGDAFYAVADERGYSLITETVTLMERTLLEGRHSPLTKSGTLLVNDVLVSCYSHLEDHHLMHYVVHWLLPFVSRDDIFGSDGALGRGDGLHAIGGLLWHFFQHYFCASS